MLSIIFYPGEWLFHCFNKKFIRFCSNLFTVPKLIGNACSILDLKYLNRFLCVCKFQMELLQLVVAFLPGIGRHKRGLPTCPNLSTSPEIPTVYCGETAFSTLGSAFQPVSGPFADPGVSILRYLDDLFLTEPLFFWNAKFLPRGLHYGKVWLGSPPLKICFNFNSVLKMTLLNQWMISQLLEAGQSFLPNSGTVVVMNASLASWGGILGFLSVQRTWILQEQLLPISILELRGYTLCSCTGWLSYKVFL